MTERTVIRKFRCNLTRNIPLLAFHTEAQEEDGGESSKHCQVAIVLPKASCESSDRRRDSFAQQDPSTVDEIISGEVAIQFPALFRCLELTRSKTGNCSTNTSVAHGDEPQ